MYQVGWDPDGVPINPNKHKFVGYIGYLAREKGPITLSSWPDYDDDLKQQIWEEVEVRYILLLLVYTTNNQTYERVIDQYVWIEFVATHQSEEFKVK